MRKLLCLILSLAISASASAALTSGTTASATTDDTAVQVCTDANGVYAQIFVVNEGSVAGFFSIDGGVTWNRLPANAWVELHRDAGFRGPDIRIKRTAGGSNLSGVYAYGF